MRVHIIGAGLAGLSAATCLAAQGIPVRVYEAAPRAGGRCRSYHDSHLDCVIDNGNHLLMSGNHAAMAYLDRIGARDQLVGPAETAYPFLDVASGAHWTLRPNRGTIPWWLLDAKRRVPGTTPTSYLSALRLIQAQPHQTVADIIPAGTPLYRNFWEPLTVAALNTAPDQAAAALMRPVLLETFLKGADACRPLVARDSLASALVDPALRFLEERGTEIRLGYRIRALVLDAAQITGIESDDGPQPVAEDELVVLATPPWVAETLIPDLDVPGPGEAIVNVHYRLGHPITEMGDVKVIGIIGGLAQWVFLRGDLASVTISAASDVTDETADSIAARCWRDVAMALGAPTLAEPPSRVIKEKRATFAQTPTSIIRRPQTVTRFSNLLLAGDWTATGLPATIEGAIRSGASAADAARKHRGTQRTEAA